VGEQVQVKADFTSVLLPDGKPHNGGDVVSLTDAEYASLSAATLRALTPLGTIADPVRPSTSTATTSDAGIAALVGDTTTATGAALDALFGHVQLRPYDALTRPWYLDTFWQFFRGLTMPAAQLTDGTSNSTLAVAASLGAVSITVANGAKFVAKEPIVIPGAGYGGTDLVTEVTAVNGNVLSLTPSVATAVPIGTVVSSLWINNAHLTGPGFTAWAAHVANAKQAKAMPGLNLFPQGTFDTVYTDALGVVNVPVGMESIGAVTFVKSNYGPAEGGAFARSGSAAQVTTSATGAGLRTLTSIKVSGGDLINVSAQMGGSYFHMTVVDKANPTTVLAQGTYDLGGSYLSSMTGLRIARRQWAHLTVPLGVSDIEVRFLSDSASTTVLIDDLRVIRSRQDSLTDRYVIEDPQGRTIVMLGDSWGDGFGGAISLEAALNARFGSVDFVNKCVAGQDLGQMLARFNTDVAPLKPLYVILEFGVNDVSHGLTATAMKANQLAVVNACRAIGAIPVILGIPPTAINLSSAHDRNDDMRAQVDSWSL
jgi:hypothetical protein